MKMNTQVNAAGRRLGLATAVLLAALPATADVTMTNWLSSDEAPLGDVGHTFAWWQTIESYQAPSGAPAIDLDTYWLNIHIDGEITGATGNPLVDPWNFQYASHDQFDYEGNWAFELVNQNTGESGIIETGAFAMNAQWHFYDPYDPVSPIYAEISGTFTADAGAYLYPDGYGPVDFSDLIFDFTGVYDGDGALLRFTLIGNEAFASAVVPEPATSVMMALAIVGLLLYARRTHHTMHGPHAQHH